MSVCLCERERDRDRETEAERERLRGYVQENIAERKYHKIFLISFDEEIHKPEDNWE